MPDIQNTSQRDELLVAIMNDRRDMAIAREQGWYRIPAERQKHETVGDEDFVASGRWQAAG